VNSVTQVDTHPEKRIVVIGGGISGLSAAWFLERAVAKHGLAARITVLEASDRWGGKVLTEHINHVDDTGFIVEAGPDSFLTQKPWALQLARELGLSDQLLGTNDQMRSIYVLHRGQPVKLPDGVLLIVPTKLIPFALSPLISPLGKLRMGFDLFMPAKRDDTDETLADFVRRRLGNEALDKIAEPLMSGIYNAEADKQSIMATFPRFRQLEREHGSLIRGMLASRRQHVSSNGAKPAAKTSMFMSLKGGTQKLIDALAVQLGCELRLASPVAEIGTAGDGYTIVLKTGEHLTADAIIITTPAYIAAKLVRPLAPSAADTLTAIRHVSTGTVSLGFPAQAIRKPLHGFGLVVPKSERRPINAITVSSTKFDHRAPDGTVLLRVFFGGSRSPESMSYDDAHMLDVVQRELRLLLGIEAPPIFHRIYRWIDANPQYDVNHLDRIAEVEAALPPGLYVTGSAFRGVGMPDCVHQAQMTSDAVVERLHQLEASFKETPR
jgi:oxygen-dependent protoporphyrinogen oxidase